MESAFEVTTVAGSLDSGFMDGRGINAHFNRPLGLALTYDGDILIADTNNHCIRKVTIAEHSPADVETFAGVPGQAGYRDGKASEALFNAPWSLSTRADGTVYVADTRNYRIRTIDSFKTVRTLAGSGREEVADGQGEEASFMSLYDITCIRGGGIYVSGNSCSLRHITEDGLVSSVAGTPHVSGHQNGDLLQGKFSDSIAQIICVDSGQTFMADENNHAIRVVDNSVRTVAGGSGPGYQDGKIDISKFYFPWGVALDYDGQIFIADHLNHRIRMVSRGSDAVPVVSTIAGCGEEGLEDGPGAVAKLKLPSYLLLDHHTNTLYFTQYHCLRKITLPKKDYQHAVLESSMMQDLKSLKPDDPSLADVKFIVDGKPIYASKTLLCVRNDCFHRMFSSRMKETERCSEFYEIPIQEVDYESFKALIVYLTTDQLTVHPRDHKGLCQLLIICDRFLASRLKLHCEHLLESQIQEDNIFELLEVAYFHGADHLKGAVFKFVVKHKDEFCDRPELRELPSELLIDLIKVL